MRHLHRMSAVHQGIRHAKALAAALEDPNCIRFTAVRDPATRAVSGFMMFFSGAGAEVFKAEGRDKQAARRESGIWTLGYEPDGDINRNFDVFLDYVAMCFEVSREHVNVHWRPQTLSIALDHISYAHICRVETLRQDLATVSDLVGFPLLPPGQEPPSVNQARRRGQFELSKEQRRKIRTLYEDDYEAFGY